MEKPAGKGLSIAYTVLAVLMALMLIYSASTKLTHHPEALKVIRDVVGVPLSLFPVLALLEIAGALGLLAGIIRPQLGVAAGIGLILYFVGAMVAHARVADWAGITAPVLPLVLSMAALTLRVLSMRRVGRV
jgi:hypothetical protein